MPTFATNLNKNIKRMKKIVYGAMALCLGWSLQSCSSSKNVAGTVSLDGEWDIVQIRGEEIVPSATSPQPFIGFDQAAGRIYGNSGCNRMMGTFSVDSLKPGILRFGPIASTRMACPDMTLERNVLDALQEVAAFEAWKGQAEDSIPRLALCDEKGRTLAVIKKRESASSEATLPEGEWLIKEVGNKPIGASEEKPFIGFNKEEGRIYGTTGCNSIMGAWETDEKNPSAIDLSKLASTMMMCPDIETEQAILEAFAKVKSYKMADGGKTLLFLDAAGKAIVRMEKR